MPTYSYACKDCGHAFDIQQAFTDDALTECPSCGGALRKVFSAVGVVFKGSGFYRTDSRGSGKSSASTTTSKDSGSKDGSSSEKKSTSSGSAGSSGSSSTSSAGGSGSSPASA